MNLINFYDLKKIRSSYVDIKYVLLPNWKKSVGKIIAETQLPASFHLCKNRSCVVCQTLF